MWLESKLAKLVSFYNIHHRIVPDEEEEKYEKKMKDCQSALLKFLSEEGKKAFSDYALAAETFYIYLADRDYVTALNLGVTIGVEAGKFTEESMPWEE